MYQVHPFITIDFQNLILVAASVLPSDLANDPTRNALMSNIRGSGGKRGLRPVSRREKKHSNFMDVLKKVRSFIS